MRALFGVLAWLAATPVCAGGPWQVMRETPAEVVAIDLSSLQHSDDRVSFRERHTLLGGQIDPASLRPVREVLTKRMVDCRSRRIATLSRAVFSDQDALIDHQAVRPHLAKWQSLPKHAPVLRLVCGPL